MWVEGRSPELSVDQAGRVQERRLVNWLTGLAKRKDLGQYDQTAADRAVAAENRATLAILRRGLGKPVGENLRLYPYIMRFVPALTDRERYESTLDSYILIATLFAHHTLTVDKGNLGTTMAAVRKEAENRRAGAESIEKRFVALLNSHRDDLPNHLRHVISLVAAREVPVNWLKLLEDIQHWDNPWRSVQSSWARSFWAEASSASSSPDNQPTGEGSEALEKEEEPA
jgi:CRISPR system Cascade subunit CasB